MLLVVNAGSSSLKLAAFEGPVQVAQARAERLAPDGHGAALTAGMAAMGLRVADLGAAAHRVVHGGEHFTQACRIDAAVLAGIEACVPIAPLHNPANLMAIRALMDLAPDLPQFASFDTAFHATNPAVAVTYALPLAERARGIRRYGFHGLSYAAIVRKMQEMGLEGAGGKVLMLHLGNGASACAVVDGLSVASSMGYSPLDGLTMGTRAGGIDGNAVLRLAEVHGIARAGQILNRESGLLALGGDSDLRGLHAAGTEAADFAIAHFSYWALRHAGSLVAAMGGLDAVVFTGGIGENDAGVRQAILDGLAFLGPKPVHVIAADEEAQIAREARALMAAG